MITDRELADILTAEGLAGRGGSGSGSGSTHPPPINQRFLLNTLRSVDDHNKGVIGSGSGSGSASTSVSTSTNTNNIPGANSPNHSDQRTPDSRSFADFQKKKRRRVDDKPSKTSRKTSRETTTIPSKMDKYFEHDYDPAIDFTPPEDANEMDFDAWNTMLDTIDLRNKRRRQREAELWEEEKHRQRHRSNQQLGREKAKVAKLLGPDAEKEYKSRKREEKRIRKEQTRESIKLQAINSVGSYNEDNKSDDLFNMEYSKKGSTRAWDVVLGGKLCTSYWLGAEQQRDLVEQQNGLLGLKGARLAL
ncbi:hypothetical protein E3P98_03097 [Wallemia ichthyophaga]|nr:hypothetical protein E3P98_03097 [Wallemia ichthyophaga]